MYAVQIGAYTYVAKGYVERKLILFLYYWEKHE